MIFLGPLSIVNMTWVLLITSASLPCLVRIENYGKFESLKTHLNINMIK